MITVTPGAAQQIRVAASQSGADEMGLRIAARRDPAGAIHYAMGFDEARDGDVVVPSEGVALVVAEEHRALLEGMTLDYVEYETGDFRFIFINPNETPAQSSAAPGARGGCGSGGCGCAGGSGSGSGSGSADRDRDRDRGQSRNTAHDVRCSDNGGRITDLTP